MSNPNACWRCSEALGSPVRFCPFCAARQQDGVRAVAPEGPSAPTAPPADWVVPPLPIPAIEPEPQRPLRADAGTWEPPPPNAPQSGAPSPNALPSGSPPPSTQPPSAPPPVAPPPVIPVAPPVAPQRPMQRTARTVWPATSRRARPNPGRNAAIRRLAAAAFVLFCAVVLWQQLVAMPHGTLSVHLNRPADGGILVDGIASGAPDRAISLSPGRHRIGLDAAGFDTPQRIVSLRAGETASLTLFPSPRPAMLVLDSTPAGAAISLDGRAIGRTPLQRPLPPGRHRIVATAPDFQRLVQEIAPEPGATLPLSLSLSPVPLRRIALDAPAGRWSAPVMPGNGTRFTLLFRDAIRVRIAGRVVLLQPGAPVELGASDASGVSVAAVGDETVPVQMLIAATRGPSD